MFPAKTNLDANEKADVFSLYYYCMIGQGIFVTCNKKDFQTKFDCLNKNVFRRIGFSDFKVLLPKDALKEME